MNHAELSRDLALAIGYHPESVWQDSEKRQVLVYGQWSNSFLAHWCSFDYRSPDVYGPLLKWLMREHGGCSSKSEREYMRVGYQHPNGGFDVKVCDTLEEAIARACIALKGTP